LSHHSDQQDTKSTGRHPLDCTCRVRKGLLSRCLLRRKSPLDTPSNTMRWPIRSCSLDVRRDTQCKPTHRQCYRIFQLHKQCMESSVQGRRRTYQQHRVCTRWSRPRLNTALTDRGRCSCSSSDPRSLRTCLSDSSHTLSRTRSCCTDPHHIAPASASPTHSSCPLDTVNTTISTSLHPAGRTDQRDTAYTSCSPTPSTTPTDTATEPRCPLDNTIQLDMSSSSRLS
jgi:hypothetical protein